MLGFVYLVLVSTITAMMGTVLLFRRVSLFTRGVRARGEFTRWELRGARRVYYHPVVKFTAHDGKEYEFVSGPGSTRKKERGVYGVIYPPGAPGKAMVLSFLAFWAAPLAFFILSVGAAFAAFQWYSK